MTDIARTKAPDEKFCSECGAIIRAKAEICPKCGVRQAMVSPGSMMMASNGRSRLAAALFALLLGGFGIHKFYLGRVGWGVVYLLFCWTLIPAVIGLLEGIVLLAMSDQEFNVRYGGA